MACLLSIYKVILLSTDIEMDRVDTCTIMTEMIDLLAEGNRPIVKFPTDSMGSENPTILTPLRYSSITTLGYRSCPQPTRVGLLDFEPEALFQGFAGPLLALPGVFPLLGSSLGVLALIVKAAEALSKMSSRAVLYTTYSHTPIIHNAEVRSN